MVKKIRIALVRSKAKRPDQTWESRMTVNKFKVRKRLAQPVL
jgi:hypothetical protein